MMNVKPRLAGVLWLTGLLSLPLLGRAEVIEQILVKVNGEIFTKSHLENRQVLMLRQRNQQMNLQGDLGNEELRKALDEITPRLIVDVVDEMLIVQRGSELGYKLSDEQFKSVVENIRKENKLDSDEQFQAALTREGVTMDDLRRNLERQMITQRVQQNEVFGKVGVSEEESRAYYQSHLDEFTTPVSITLREILVAIPADSQGINVAQDEAAQARANEIRSRAAAESFEKLAADLSDAPSKANGGLIGPINVTDLSPDLRKVIDQMKVGDISQALRTTRGYQLLKLESSTPAQTMPFEVAREQIAERVVTGKRRDEFEKYLVKLRSQAIIEWKNPELKKAYDEGLKQTAAQPAS